MATMLRKMSTKRRKSVYSNAELMKLKSLYHRGVATRPIGLYTISDEEERQWYMFCDDGLCGCLSVRNFRKFILFFLLLFLSCLVLSFLLLFLLFSFLFFSFSFFSFLFFSFLFFSFLFFSFLFFSFLFFSFSSLFFSFRFFFF